MAHAAQELALGPLYRPLRLKVFFGFVDQLRDVNDPRGPVSVGPIKSLDVLRSHFAVARFAGSHAKLLVVDDFTFAQGARPLTGSTLLLVLHPVAKVAQGLALVVEFPLLRFRSTVTRPPRGVAAFFHFLAAPAVVGLDVPARTAASAYFVLLPLEPDLPALTCFGVGIPVRPMLNIPTCEAPSRQLGLTGY